MPVPTRAFFLGVLALLGPVLAQAATVHVSPSGSDGNPCASGRAKQTIAAGVACLKGGDTLVLHQGTYLDQPIAAVPSGTAGVRTTIKSAGDGPVTLRCTTTAHDAIVPVSTNYVTIDGLILDGGGSGGCLSLVRASRETTGFTIRNSHLMNSRGSGLFSHHGHQWRVEHNEIDHCGTDSNFNHCLYFSAHDSIIRNNDIHHAQCYNLQNYASAGASPVNNVIEGNTFRESGCGVTSQGSGHRIVGNTFYNDAARLGPNGGGLLIDGPNQTVINNTFYCNTILTISGGDSGGTVQDNTFACPTADLRLQTKAASLSNNRITRDAMPAPTGRPTLTSQPTQPSQPSQPTPPRPAPRNLRVVPGP